MLQAVVTDIAYRASHSWQNEGQGANFTVSLSLTTHKPNSDVRRTLIVCGRSATNVLNDDNNAEIQCIRPMRSLYVIVEAEHNAIVVCEFYVYSKLANFLLT